MDYIKVKDKNYLLRDSHSNAIVNSDYENYRKYIDTYKIKKDELNKIKSLEKDVSSLKEDIGEIKSLLKNIIDNKLL